MLLFLFIITAPTAAASTCTYTQYETDASRWGGGYCWIGDNTTGADACSGVGTCILNKCYCPGDRGAPNCQYVRFDRKLQGALGIILGLGGVGFINEFIVHNFPFAFGQLLVAFAGGLMFFIAFRFASKEKHKFCLLLFGVCIIVVACTWSVIDGVMILTCSTKDGNGYSYSSETSITLTSTR